MMRFSRLADFAVVLMTHVAQGHGKVLSAAEIAAATRLPAPTVAKVLARLCRAGLLGSVRGVKGGYMLRRPAASISVGAIVSAVDGPVALMQCIKPGSARCEVEPVCPSRVGLQAVNVAVQKALEDVSLADIAMPVLAIRVLAQPLSSGYPSATKADQHRGSP